MENCACPVATLVKQPQEDPQQDLIKHVQSKGPAEKIDGVLFISCLAFRIRKLPERRMNAFTYVLTLLVDPEFQFGIYLRNVKAVQKVSLIEGHDLLPVAVSECLLQGYHVTPKGL